MAKKKNRCQIASCRAVIKDDFLFCYWHRFEVAQKELPKITPPVIEELKRFWCEKCGQSFRHRHTLGHCTFCGGKLEEVT